MTGQARARAPHGGGASERDHATRPVLTGVLALQRQVGNAGVSGVFSPAQQQDAAFDELSARVAALESEWAAGAGSSSPRRHAQEVELVRLRGQLVDLLRGRIARLDAEVAAGTAVFGGAPSPELEQRLVALRARLDADRRRLVPLLAWRTRLELRHLDAAAPQRGGDPVAAQQRADVLAAAIADTAAAGPHRLGERGERDIKASEGGPYRDRYDPGDPSRATIGWGHLITTPEHPRGAPPGPWIPPEYRVPITPEFAQRLFDQDVARFVAAVNREVRVPLTQEQFDALVSFAYNGGEGMLRQLVRSSGLNDGRYDEVARRLPRFNRADGRENRGLTNRRAREAALYDLGSELGRDVRPEELHPPHEAIVDEQHPHGR